MLDCKDYYMDLICEKGKKGKKKRKEKGEKRKRQYFDQKVD